MKTTFQITEDVLQPWGRRPSGVRGRRLVQVNRRRPTGSTEDDLQGQPKTTFKVKRRRPSRPNEDDLRANRRRPSGPIEDDLQGRLKTTFGANRRRPSARPRGRRLSSTRKSGRRPSPVRKTTFHSSHRLPMQLHSRLPKSDRARVCIPEAAPSSTTLPERRDRAARPLTKS